MIGASLLAAMGPWKGPPQPAQLIAPPARAGSFESPGRGDRLVKTPDIASESRSFRASVAEAAGDRQVLQIRGFTHVSTTLALASTGAAGQVPPPQAIGDGRDPALAKPSPSEGAALDGAAVSFSVVDLAGADPRRMVGAPSLREVETQVRQFIAAMPASGAGSVASASSVPAWSADHAADAAPATMQAGPFGALGVRTVFANVTTVPRSDPGPDGTGTVERLVVLRQGETLKSMLRANGASSDDAATIVDAFGDRRGDPPGAGRRLRLLVEPPDASSPTRILRLSAYSGQLLESMVAIDDRGAYAKVATGPGPAVQDADDDGSGLRVYDSLYETALRLKIPKQVIGELVRTFGRDVDLQSAVAAGDTFEAFYGDGPSGGPELLYASVTLRGEPFRYHRFRNPDDGSVGFYDENGRSTLKLLIRDPVPKARITSVFGMRFHPILGYARPHTGVDWGAPTGTPILAAGDGTVLTARHESAYGNRVEIQHANGYVTTYSHMEGFGPGVTDGARIKQGQTVGYLGQTGLATGPHLHYEVMVNGRFVDPMKVKLTETRELPPRALAAFKSNRDAIDGLMANAGNGTSLDQRHAAN